MSCTVVDACKLVVDSSIDITARLELFENFGEYADTNLPNRQLIDKFTNSIPFTQLLPYLAKLARWCRFGYIQYPTKDNKKSYKYVMKLLHKYDLHNQYTR